MQRSSPIRPGARDAGGTSGTRGPTDRFERRAKRRGARFVAGVDEAGRGPLAGPVVVAAVMFPDRRYPDGLNDSKKLTALQRERLYELILKRASVSIAIAVGRASTA